MSQESPKAFLDRQVLNTLYGKILSFLRRHPDVDITGYVHRISSHYVHQNTIKVELEDTADDSMHSIGFGRLVDELQEEMQERVQDLSTEIYSDLESDYEHQTSDEAVAEALDSNERYFDAETGSPVEIDDLKTVDQLPDQVKGAVVQQYADLFDRTPEQVMQALMARKVKFDNRGNKVDTSVYKRVSELPDGIKRKVLDAHRDWNVQESFWSESLLEYWKEQLEGEGFIDPDIAFSGFSNQGDGASFTCKSIDIRKYLEERLKGMRKRAVAKRKAQP